MVKTTHLLKNKTILIVLAIIILCGIITCIALLCIYSNKAPSKAFYVYQSETNSQISPMYNASNPLVFTIG